MHTYVFNEALWRQWAMDAGLITTDVVLSPPAPENVVALAQVKSDLFVHVPHDEDDLEHPNAD